MALERVWPEDVYKRTLPGFDRPVYAQVVVAQPGKRSISIAGTFAADVDFKIIGEGSMRLQVRAVLENIGRSVAAVGGTPADIVRTKTYVTDIEAYVREGHEEWMSFFGDHTPASTAVQVVALADPRCVVEIEAYAELD